jgi:hypothetical protein
MRRAIVEEKAQQFYAAGAVPLCDRNQAAFVCAWYLVQSCDGAMCIEAAKRLGYLLGVCAWRGARSRVVNNKIAKENG